MSSWWDNLSDSARIALFVVAVVVGLVIFVAVLWVTTSTPPTGTVVDRPAVTIWHDDQRAVTCWIWDTHGYRGGISCLPDAQVHP